MLRFNDRPISQKLVIITMVTTTAALVLAGLGIVISDSLLFRRYLERDLSTLARIVADNSTAALAFDDPASARQTLGALRARTQIHVACIYKLDGSILAKYGATACPPPQVQRTIKLTGRSMTVYEPILLDGSRIGTLTLLYDLGEVTERIRLYGATVLGFLFAASLVAFLMSSQLRSVIADPISSLVRATASVSKSGDYSVRAQKLSNDELGVLVDRFNEMLAGIQSRDNDLKRALGDVERERERFRFMAESMPQKIFTADAVGNPTYFSRQWADFTGSPVDHLGGSSWERLVHPDDKDQTVDMWRKSIATGEPLQITYRLRRADGVYRWHLTRAHPMRDAEGHVMLWIGSSTDIHEQKETEEELRRANEDLQQFAYSASHDLQEPIRNVAVYSEVVAKRYKDALDADGRLYLGFLEESGRRLATLVNDLLAYTRASRAEVSDTEADASEALSNALASLSEAIRQSGATVSYDPLPSVSMGDAHLQQVFQNLVSNALKYCNEAPPQIHVSAVEDGRFWRFSVEDNGIGIDPRYKEKIFGLFKRLHHDEKYSGTGIGLAICQRVVERYGGRIWVESEPGHGATFFFTVPQRVA